MQIYFEESWVEIPPRHIFLETFGIDDSSIILRNILQFRIQMGSKRQFGAEPRDVKNIINGEERFGIAAGCIILRNIKRAAGVITVLKKVEKVCNNLPSWEYYI